MAKRVERPKTTTRRNYARKQGALIGKVKFTQFNRASERATYPIIGFLLGGSAVQASSAS